MPDKIISKPEHDSEDENIYHQFGYCEIQGFRKSQEDALAWEVLPPELFQNLSPTQVGHRMWTAYQNLSDQLFTFLTKDKITKKSGTTASTTVISKDYIVTATLADTVAFAVIYDTNGRVVKAHRLNKRILTPIAELERIKAARGVVIEGRVQGVLAVSRAIGDYTLNVLWSNGGNTHFPLPEEPSRIIPDADIDIWSLSSVPTQYTVQIITTCDGFTEIANEKNIDHAQYLMNFLNKMKNNHPSQPLSELEIAKQLVNFALEDGSKDNISVSVQTKSANFTGMTGIYDGHDGTASSHYVAENIGAELTRLLTLNEADYDQEKNSVTNRKKDYERDNGKCRVNTHDLGRDLPPPVAATTNSSAGIKRGLAGAPTFLADKTPYQGKRKKEDPEENETKKPKY